MVQDVLLLCYHGLLILWNPKPEMVMVFYHSNSKVTETDPKERDRAMGLARINKASFFLAGQEGHEQRPQQGL